MAKTRFLYFGNQYIGEADETNTVTKRYVNEPDTYTNLIGQHDVGSGNNRYHHYDAVGSTRAVTDDTETVTDSFTFDAWGNVLSRTGTNEIPFQYVGEYGYYRDEESANYYVMARIYNSWIGLWLSIDPLSQHNSMYQYLYVSNNPSKMADPSGFVERDFSPTKPDEMAWCEVGTRTQQNPGGLKPKVYGDIDPIYYEIICACQCCDEVLNHYSLKCTVRSYLRIRIAQNNIPPSWIIGEVYGHEQLHVRNLLEGAEIWAKEAEKREAEVGCGKLSVCKWQKMSLEFVGNNALNNWKEREKEHMHPSGHPEEGGRYSPIGSDGIDKMKGMGKEDCKPPGTPKKSPESKLCC